MDCAALARRVASLEDRHDAFAGLLLPELYLDQLDLELFECFLVFVVVELLFVRVVVGAEGLFVDPVRKVRVVDIEDPLLAVDIQFHGPAFGIFRHRPLLQIEVRRMPRRRRWSQPDCEFKRTVKNMS